jgi:hypothetical protein
MFHGQSLLVSIFMCTYMAEVAYEFSMVVDLLRAHLFASAFQVVSVRIAADSLMVVISQAVRSPEHVSCC